MLELQARGFDVPRDVSVVGMDDLEFASHIPPGLTTVRLPTYQLGTMAAELTLQRLRGDATPHRIELPIELVVRGTTTAPAHDAGRAAPAISTP